jgi:hypothetical protein
MVNAKALVDGAEWTGPAFQTCKIAAVVCTAVTLHEIGRFGE